uniref:NmrA-like domain-containing protein n=1 Tax=Polysiphonia sertularioides TaxID=945028 RepID=A0A1Z1M998_9FLOR|nr:hypothetical protein [Polysiphonia sertularioides]ARW62472.1 hypothetical protein [Polysiphonia sertularioides]
MTLLILGGSGTLGRQVVRKSLNEGFNVKCLVRNFRKAAFLKEWGVELVYGDLILPETIPLSLIGVTAIIDCSTGRPDEDYDLTLVDLVAKYIVIESAIIAKIKHFIFFSILNSSSYIDVKLIMLKMMVEKRIKVSGLSFTIFCVPGFFQGLISQYALPILDKKTVWITSESSQICYVSTEDVAAIAIKSLSVSQFKNIYLPLAGSKSWKSLDIIEMCELISGRRANTNQVSIYTLKILQNFVNLFQWSQNIAERLAFTGVLLRGYNATAEMKEILYILQLSPHCIEPLEIYLQEYFERVTKKIRELNYQNFNNDKNFSELDF